MYIGNEDFFEFASQITSPNENALKTNSFLQKSKLLDLFSNKTIIEIIGEISFEEFIGFIIRINGLIVGKKIKDRKIKDNVINISSNMVHSHGFIGKMDALRKLFENLKHFDDTEKISILTYIGLLIIHPFEKGNGRTARTIYTLFIGNSSSKANLVTDTYLASDGNNIGRSKMLRKISIIDTTDKLKRKMLLEIFGVNVNNICISLINLGFCNKFKGVNEQEKWICKTLGSLADGVSILSLGVYKLCIENKSLTEQLTESNGNIIIKLNENTITKEILLKLIQIIQELENIYLSNAIEYVRNYKQKNTDEFV